MSDNISEKQLKKVLKECINYANEGYKIAINQTQRLNVTLSNAINEIQNTLIEFNNSPCYVPEAHESLVSQLSDIQNSFNNLSASFKNDLVDLRKDLSKFSITLFGRTKAGKSTLMEVLTHGDGASIGKGGQRTTRDVRTYKWKGLEITDVPGVCAFEGLEDEQIAFNAAKNADLVLFLINDDGTQPAEAECLGKIIDLGKPVVCVMNVKTAISDDDEFKYIIQDIDDEFDREKLDIKRDEFLSYSKKLGQDWGYIPFIYVHLKSAFMAQQEKNKEHSRIYYKKSKISYLESKIIEIIQNKGNFYRIRTFVDCISKPLIKTIVDLLEFSQVNSSQGRTFLEKKRKLVNWKEKYIDENKNEINSLLLSIKTQLNAEIPSFVEDHFSDKNADKEWDKVIKKHKIHDQYNDYLFKVDEKCNDQIKEISREIAKELNYITSINSDKIFKMKRIIDNKRIWNWSTTIIGGGLTIASIIAAYVGATITAPLTISALVVGAIKFVGDIFLKSKSTKEQEAKRKLENYLKKNIDTINEKIKKLLLKHSDIIISDRISRFIKEMENIDSIVFRLADTQRKLAWEIDDNYLELNSQYVNKAINIIGEEGLDDYILSTARIPGNSILFMLNDGIVIPKEKIELLHRLMSEKINFVFYTENKQVLVSRVLGKMIDRNKIHIEDKIGVAHLQCDNVSPYLQNRIILAQQFAKLLIMK